RSRSLACGSTLDGESSAHMRMYAAAEEQQPAFLCGKPGCKQIDIQRVVAFMRGVGLELIRNLEMFVSDK
ncbi:MAG: hypothetical protein R6T89_01610, partial [Candidatus Syntrophosphaera sp.]